MEHNRIIPKKPIPDDKLKKEIKNFKFLYNMAILKILIIIEMVIFLTILMCQVIPQSIN